MVNVLIQEDWEEGDDPGMNMWRVPGADGVMLVAADVTSWTLKVYDLTVDPTVGIVPDSNSSGTANSNNFRTFNSLQVGDGFWSKDDIGYNLRHYVNNADLTSTPFKAGHTYLFVYKVLTSAFSGSSGDFGQITLQRRGTCRGAGGL